MLYNISAQFFLLLLTNLKMFSMAQIYWEKDLETISRNDLEKLQLERLKATLGYALQSQYYKTLFKEKNLSIDSFQSIRDIHKIPFTTKENLRGHFPYGFLAAEKKDVIRLHSSSGTTGNPTVVFHSKHDLDSWANLVARSMFTAGIRDTDVFQNICGYGLFTGGLGFQYGAERLGALTIPAGAGNSKRQIKLMQDYGTTAIHTIPSYVPHLVDVFRDSNLDPRTDTDLRIMVIGAEPHTEETRQRIQEMLDIKAFNSYGLSEMNGPGVAFECNNQNGMHIWEDCYFVEVINPETLEPVANGEVGELILTTLDRQAMPILRYRTRDLTRIISEPCECGRTHRRIDRIKGRSDDMFIIKGCNVFPMQIEKILMQIPEIGQNYLIILETINDTDEIIVEVEVKDGIFMDTFAKLERLTKHITNEVKNEILVTPKVKLLEPNHFPPCEGKAVRVKDMRKHF
jgi:phenylacetate-CoA ligase